MPERRQASGAALWSGDPDLSKPGGPRTQPHRSENGSQCKPRAPCPNFGLRSAERDVGRPYPHGFSRLRRRRGEIASPHNSAGAGGCSLNI
jgi:hypothetical protein